MYIDIVISNVFNLNKHFFPFLCEIGLFHIVLFLKVPMIIIMRFSENKVLGPKYINIYQFRGLAEGHGSPKFFVYYS